jgi:hypothetical protein
LEFGCAIRHVRIVCRKPFRSLPTLVNIRTQVPNRT